MIFEDQLARARGATRASVGTQGGELDFALLVDGLAAEREQGITIDVAYRFFATERRKFIVADTPGHEQYTRNMVTGASTADLAVILIDARKGVLTQTRRHSYLVSLLGIRHVVLAVNKMDLVGYARAALRRRSSPTTAPSPRSIGLADVTAIPMSALRGDNVIAARRAHALVRGPDAASSTWRRSPIDGRGCTARRSACRCSGSTGRISISAASPGTIASGSVAPGDRVRVLPSGRESRVARIVTEDGDLRAGRRRPVGHADARRRDRRHPRRRARRRPTRRPRSPTSSRPRIVWMAEEPMLPGRPTC